MGRTRDSLYEESELATEERSPNSPPKREFEESELPTEERIATEERRTCALFITCSSVIFLKNCFMLNTH
jgi:hypothetical protein